MNAALRSGPEEPLTLFRIFTALFMPFMMLRYFPLLAKEIGLMVLLVVLSGVQYALFHLTTRELFISSYIHILFVFAVYVCVKLRARVDQQNFEADFFRFLDKFTVFTIALTLIELIFSISIFPATQSRSCPTAFFWNENELCGALFVMLPLYFLQWKKSKSIVTLLKMALILYFVYAFDCRVLILAALFMGVLFFILNKKLKIDHKLLLLLIFIFLCIGLVLFFYIDFEIPSGKEYTYALTFGDVVREPVLHILHLERFNLLGSVYDRADAVIIGLQHLLKTGGIGIGLGGCLKILDGELVTAVSMHNLFVQTIVEIGLIAFIVYVIYLFKLYFQATRLAWFKVCFFMTIPLSSAISSGGIMSNYMFWGIVFYVFFMQKNPWETGDVTPTETTEKQV